MMLRRPSLDRRGASAPASPRSPPAARSPTPAPRRRCGRPAGDKPNGNHLHAVPVTETVAEPSADTETAGAEPGRTLAERIRSLQHAARH
jgi:hypothetical protein